MKDKIEFKILQEKDLPLMHKWLNTPHVSEWWNLDGNHNPSLSEVNQHYSPRIKGTDPVDVYLIIYDNKPIGMVQSYRLDDYPDDKATLGLDQSYTGIDIFIGEENYVHRGLGSAILKKFLKDIVFTKYDETCCLIDPEPKNEIAIKAYNRAGFRHVKTIWNQADTVFAYVMSISRDAFYPEKG